MLPDGDASDIVLGVETNSGEASLIMLTARTQGRLDRRAETRGGRYLGKPFEPQSSSPG